MNDDDQISRYLDQLMSRLRGSPKSVRRVLNETESHLRDAANEGMSRGLPEDAAQHEAIAKFGTAKDVARASNRVAQSGTFRIAAGDVIASGWTLATIGLLAIGISGLLMRVAQSIAGIGAVFGPSTGSHLSSGNCAYWLSIHPAAATCTRAYTIESSQDQLLWHLAAGILGIALLSAGLVIRHFHKPQSVSDARAWLIATIGFTSFAGAALFLGAYGVDQLATGTENGAWQWLCESLVALVAASCFGFRLFRRVRDSATDLERASA